MFFKTPDIANTSSKNAQSQITSADKLLAASKENAPTLSRVFDQSRLQEGRNNSDFWAGQKQNLSGVRNVGNGANRGADMGAEFSVMTGAGDADSLSANNARGQRKAASSVADWGSLQTFKTGVNSLQQTQDIFDTQNKIEQQNGTWNAIAEGLNGAVSGFMSGNELFNKGGLERIGSQLKKSGANIKAGFKGQTNLWDSLRRVNGLNNGKTLTELDGVNAWSGGGR